jgi:hypothetical protein
LIPLKLKGNKKNKILLWQFSVLGVGKGILKKNSPLMLSKYVASVQNITVPVSSLLYLDLNPFSREGENTMKHHIPPRGHRDNKILVCL